MAGRNIDYCCGTHRLENSYEVGRIKNQEQSRLLHTRASDTFVRGIFLLQNFFDLLDAFGADEFLT